MSKVQATWLNLSLVPSTGDLELIFRKRELSFHTVYSYTGLGHVSDDEREPIHTSDQAFQSLDQGGPPLSQTLPAQLVPAAVNTKNEFYTHICKYIWCTIPKEVSHEYSRRSLQAMQEAVKNAILNLLITGTVKVDCEFEKRLPKVHRDGICQHDREESAGRNTWLLHRPLDQSTSIMNAFVSHALTSSRFIRTVAQFMKSCKDEKTDEWLLTAKVKEFSQAKIGN